MTRIIDPDAIDRFKLSSPPQYDREDPKKDALANLRELNRYCDGLDDDEAFDGVTLDEFREFRNGGYMKRNHHGPRKGFNFLSANLTDEQLAPVLEALCAAEGETAEESLATVCREWLAMRALNALRLVGASREET